MDFNFRKKAVWILAAALLLAACGQKGTGSVPAAQEKPAAESTAETAAETAAESAAETKTFAETAAEIKTSAETAASVTQSSEGPKESAGSPAAEKENRPDAVEKSTEAADEKVENAGNGDIRSRLSPLIADPDYLGPLPGEPALPVEGGFETGRIVNFTDRAFFVRADGIYRIQKDREEECLVKGSFSPETRICTDGSVLYYVDENGFVREMEIGSPEAPARISSDEYILPEGSGVIGAGRDYVYIQTPYREELAPSGRLLSETFPSVIFLRRDTGLYETFMEGYEGGCAGGVTYVCEYSTDVTPRRMVIYDFQGNTLADEPQVWNAASCMGTVWYSRTDAEADRPNISLMRLDIDEPKEVLSREIESGQFYGISVRGFLAVIGSEEDGGEYVSEYVDLRTLEPVPDALFSIGGFEGVSWAEGCTEEGADYLLGATRVCLAENDGPVDIFDLPADIPSERICLAQGHILVQTYDGDVLVYDLEPDNTVHPIPVTSAVKTYVYGTEGLEITGHYPELMKDNNYQWSGLMKSAALYNKDVEERFRAYAEECFEMAETLAGEGVYDDMENPPLKAEIRDYIQRADTLAFSFMEHSACDLLAGQQLPDRRRGYNYSTQDGHRLLLAEVVKDTGAAGELAGDSLAEKYPRFEKEIREALAELFKEEQTKQAENAGQKPQAGQEQQEKQTQQTKQDRQTGLSWVLGYEGVTFYFDQFQLPGIRGTEKIYLSFSEHPEIFAEKYMQAPKAYAYDVMLGTEYVEEYQLESGDGILTALFYVDRDRIADNDGASGNEENEEDSGDPRGLHVWVSHGPFGTERDGTDRVIGIGTDSVSGTLVHIKDNTPQNVLAVKTMKENGEASASESRETSAKEGSKASDPESGREPADVSIYALDGSLQLLEVRLEELLPLYRILPAK